MSIRAALFSICVAVAALSPAQAGAADWSKIRIGADGHHPPFNMLDELGRLQGFEIDLARAICARIKADCEFIRQDFEGLVPALVAGRYDAVFSSLSNTEKRRAMIDFTDKYYSTNSIFAVRKENAGVSVAPADAKGRVFGARGGSTNIEFLRDVYGPSGATIRSYETLYEARRDLAEGRIDVLAGDKSAMLYWLEKTPWAACCQVVGQDLRDARHFGDGIGAAVRKSDPELKTILNRALKDLRASGDYERIRSRYIPYDIY